MKTIFKIAKLEFKTLFYSPIAWLLTIIFTVQSGLDFITRLNNSLMYQGEGNRTYWLTQNIFSNKYTSVFLSVEHYLYLYIPLLTMGLMSREFSGGGIKLLLSSPIKIREIVLGKFIAIMGYWIILMLILGTFVFCGYLSIEAFEVKFILSGLLGIFLLAGAYSAIGLFMSCLTSYQVVAAISTLVVLGLLNFIGGIWQGIPVIRDITWFLNITQHSVNMVTGLLVSKDILYFLILTLLFLGLSILVLQDGIQSRPLRVKAGRYFLFITMMLLVSYFSSRPKLIGYYDMTVSKENTLTPVSQDILNNIKGTVTITAFDNLFALHLAGISQPDRINDNLQAWSPYQRFLPGLQLKYVSYYDSVENNPFQNQDPGLTLKALAQKLAKAKKIDFRSYLSPDEIHKIIDLRSMGNPTIFLVQNGNKNTFLWDMPSNDLRGIGSERNVTTAFKRLVVNAPKVAFLEGNNERSINKTGDEFYRMAVNDPDQGSSLTHIGFDVITVSADKPIPDSIATLVIADPATPFNETELQQIGQYLTKGGNLFITGGKGHQSILKPLLDSFGVHFMDGTVIETGKDSLPADLYAKIAPQAIRLSSGYASFIEDSLKVSLPDGAIALEYKNSGKYDITPLLISNEKNSWNKTGEFKSDTGKIFYNPLAGDNQSSLPVAIGLTRQTGTKQQRIMIIGNANFMDNHELSKYSIDQGRFIHEIFKWLSYDQFPINISRPVIYNRIKINYKELGRMKLLLVGLLPVLIFLFGGIFLLLRKRK